jgi:hypothetical protein
VEYKIQQWRSRHALKAFVILLLVGCAKSQQRQYDTRFLVDEAGSKTWISSVVALLDNTFRTTGWFKELVGVQLVNAREGAEPTNGLSDCFEKSRRKEKYQVYLDPKVLPPCKIAVYRTDNRFDLPEECRITEPSELFELYLTP